MAFQEPKLVSLDGFLISGLSVRTKNSEEFDPNTAKLPKLWEAFSLKANHLPFFMKNSEIFGVYTDYESDATGYYNVTVGGLTEKVLPEFSTVKIHSGNYLVFSGKGVMPKSVIETWLRIWSYFESYSECKRNFISDFELYRGDEISIHIGVTIESSD
ncbi:GyrI-like domain-containing protein [Legionella maceachernii]|uniref:Transcription activator n=1 Tax=Legionella maceachernii TaxID=466 RepID=A0A0W0W445_9GAMM|nr:GyrI-like domain-containing protein [Legionella maceachernii]KTD27049.1 Transcription activator [Legionella maceachernii]SKA03992.1 Predicted transcriptional regulator YdeE, contains AraC-type DNA-binding domain [Legionella maceachernii]SUP00236.1 Bacterial transcription activator, effector binding domain [Legionella maceachernii]